MISQKYCDNLRTDTEKLRFQEGRNKILGTITDANNPLAVKIAMIIREKGLKQLYVAQKAGYTKRAYKAEAPAKT